MALIANVDPNRRRGRTFKPADFNPYERRRSEGIPLTTVNIGLLKQVFVKGAKR